MHYFGASGGIVLGREIYYSSALMHHCATWGYCVKHPGDGPKYGPFRLLYWQVTDQASNMILSHFKITLYGYQNLYRYFYWIIVAPCRHIASWVLVKIAPGNGFLPDDTTKP